MCRSEGGNLNNGANNGPFYSNLRNGVTNTRWNNGALGLLLKAKYKRSACTDRTQKVKIMSQQTNLVG